MSNNPPWEMAVNRIRESFVGNHHEMTNYDEDTER